MVSNFQMEYKYPVSKSLGKDSNMICNEWTAIKCLNNTPCFIYPINSNDTNQRYYCIVVNVVPQLFR